MGTTIESSWENERLKEQLAAAQARETELMADNARLRGYLTRIFEYWTQDGNNQELFDMLCHIEETVKAELARTSAAHDRASCRRGNRQGREP